MKKSKNLNQDVHIHLHCLSINFLLVMTCILQRSMQHHNCLPKMTMPSCRK